MVLWMGMAGNDGLKERVLKINDSMEKWRRTEPYTPPEGGIAQGREGCLIGGLCGHVVAAAGSSPYH